MQTGTSRNIAKEILDEQRPHWENTFSEKPDMFGEQPSEPARKALELFKGKASLKSSNLAEVRGGIRSFLHKMDFTSLYSIILSAELRS